jgi:hypothetical protein
MTDKLTATMQLAKRVYSLAQEQNDSALMIGAYHALVCTLYHMGDFETARQYAMSAVQIWRSEGGQSSDYLLVNSSTEMARRELLQA